MLKVVCRVVVTMSSDAPAQLMVLLLKAKGLWCTRDL